MNHHHILRSSRTRGIALSLLVVLTSSCSPYAYTDKVATFATSSAAVASAASSGRTALLSDANDIRSAIFAANKLPLLASPGECAPPLLPKADAGPAGAPHDRAAAGLGQNSICTIGLDPTFKWGAGPADTPEIARQKHTLQRITSDAHGLTRALQSLAQAQPVFDQLAGYAAALSKIVDASASSSLKTATANTASATGAAVGAIQTALGADTATANTAEASAAATVLGAAIGSYRDERRYNVLKKAVVTTGPSLQAIAPVLRAAVSQARDTRISLIRDELEMQEDLLAKNEIGKVSAAEYTARYTKLQSLVDTMNSLNASDPNGTIDKMLSAHSALASAISEKKGQFAQFVTQVSAFADDVEALRKAFTPTNSSAQSTTSK